MRQARRGMEAGIERRLRTLGLFLLTVVALTAPGHGTTIPVTATADDVTVNGNCTLREAMSAALDDTAIDACPAGSPVDVDVVEVPAGTYSWSRGTMNVSNGRFLLRGPAVPAPTLPTVIVDAGNLTRFLRLYNGSEVTLENVEIRHGNADSDGAGSRGGAISAVGASLTLRHVILDSNQAAEGGGLYFTGFSAETLLIENSQFLGNLAVSTVTGHSAMGGGIYLELAGTAQGRIVDTLVGVNQARTSAAADGSAGGGIYAVTGDSSHLDLLRCSFSNNQAGAGPQTNASGGGASLLVAGPGRATILDTVWSNNISAAAAIGGAALEIQAAFGAVVELRRGRFVGNEGPNQLRAVASETSVLTVTDLLVARGDTSGIVAESYDSAIFRLGHVTATENDAGPIVLNRIGGTLRLENSLVWGNGGGVPDDPLTVDASCLIDVDPHFVDPATLDYSLAANSPALDFGNRALPSVGSTDLRRAPRTVGLDTDAGAYERGGLFADGFESGDIGGWMAPEPD